jgi:hypothetical protein
LIVGIRQWSVVGIQTAPESGNIWPPESGNIWPPKFCRCRNPVTSGHHRRLSVDQIPAETGRNLAMVRSRIWTDSTIDPVRSGQNGRDPEEFGQTCSPESGNGDQTLPDSDDSYIFAFGNFFVRAKH